MTVTLELSDREVRFLKKMVSDMATYKTIGSIEEALRECIRIAMFDESEAVAADEGI
jgi:hypothetical protein